MAPASPPASPVAPPTTEARDYSVALLRAPFQVHDDSSQVWYDKPWVLRVTGGVGSVITRDMWLQLKCHLLPCSASQLSYFAYFVCPQVGACLSSQNRGRDPSLAATYNNMLGAHITQFLEPPPPLLLSGDQWQWDPAHMPRSRSVRAACGFDSLCNLPSSPGDDPRPFRSSLYTALQRHTSHPGSGHRKKAHHDRVCLFSDVAAPHAGDCLAWALSALIWAFHGQVVNVRSIRRVIASLFVDLSPLEGLVPHATHPGDVSFVAQQLQAFLQPGTGSGVQVQTRLARFPPDGRCLPSNLTVADPLLLWVRDAVALTEAESVDHTSIDLEASMATPVYLVLCQLYRWEPRQICYCRMADFDGEISSIDPERGAPIGFIVSNQVHFHPVVVAHRDDPLRARLLPPGGADTIVTPQALTAPTQAPVPLTPPETATEARARPAPTTPVRDAVCGAPAVPRRTRRADSPQPPTRDSPLQASPTAGRGHSGGRGSLPPPSSPRPVTAAAAVPKPRGEASQLLTPGSERGRSATVAGTPGGGRPTMGDAADSGLDSGGASDTQTQSSDTAASSPASTHLSDSPSPCGAGGRPRSAATRSPGAKPDSPPANRVASPIAARDTLYQPAVWPPLRLPPIDDLTAVLGPLHAGDFVLATDGACPNNGSCSRHRPSHLGWGYAIYDHQLSVVRQAAGYEGFTTSPHQSTFTNNTAEYRGLQAGLQAAVQCQLHLRSGARRLLVCGDSKIVRDQMKGVANAQDHLRPLNVETQTLASTLRPLTLEFFNVPREQNRRADALANLGIDRRSTYEWDHDEDQRADLEWRAQPPPAVPPRRVTPQDAVLLQHNPARVCELLDQCLQLLVGPSAPCTVSHIERAMLRVLPKASLDVSRDYSMPGGAIFLWACSKLSRQAERGAAASTPGSRASLPSGLSVESWFHQLTLRVWQAHRDSLLKKVTGQGDDAPPIPMCGNQSWRPQRSEGGGAIPAPSRTLPSGNARQPCHVTSPAGQREGPPAPPAPPYAPPGGPSGSHQWGSQGAQPRDKRPLPSSAGGGGRPQVTGARSPPPHCTHTPSASSQRSGGHYTRVHLPGGESDHRANSGGNSGPSVHHRSGSQWTVLSPTAPAPALPNDRSPSTRYRPEPRSDQAPGRSGAPVRRDVPTGAGDGRPAAPSEVHRAGRPRGGCSRDGRSCHRDNRWDEHNRGRSHYGPCRDTHRVASCHDNSRYSDESSQGRLRPDPPPGHRWSPKRANQAEYGEYTGLDTSPRHHSQFIRLHGAPHGAAPRDVLRDLGCFGVPIPPEIVYLWGPNGLRVLLFPSVRSAATALNTDISFGRQYRLEPFDPSASGVPARVRQDWVAAARRVYRTSHLFGQV